MEKLHPIAFASKHTSATKEHYKPFLLKFVALKFRLEKFDNIIWGLRMEVETDCQALHDMLSNTELSTTHVRWRDGVMAHQIIGVHHIPGKVNLVADTLSRQGKDIPHASGDRSRWSVVPDWENSHGLAYDLFHMAEMDMGEFGALRDRF